MTFNLDRYALSAPEGLDDAAPAAPPPGADAIVRAIRQASPDVLAVQGMGPPDAWDDFRFRLRQAGLEYRFEEYLSRDDDQELRLAVLSRHPIVSRSPRIRDRYTIGPGQFPVLRGFIELDIEPDPGYRFRLFVAHLKSKRFHEHGQAAMRRTEARQLANHIRASLQENPGLNLLVAGDFSDEPAPAPCAKSSSTRASPSSSTCAPPTPMATPGPGAPMPTGICAPASSSSTTACSTKSCPTRPASSRPPACGTPPPTVR
jgi:endonuclease/exonuclease/phosphatase family metal-dependent hydrolase